MRLTSLTGIGLGIAGLALLWKGFANSNQLELRCETVRIPHLPKGFQGFRILQISDLHLRQYSARGEELLQKIEEIDPDLVCLTGDYAFTSLSLPNVEAFFDRLAQRPAVVGIFGNADYRPGITDEIRAHWNKFFPFLSNSALCLERQGESIWIAGVDDPHLGRDSVMSAMDMVPANATTILLAHSPEVILRPLDPRIRLILSGHTHGGQICLPGGQALYHNTLLPKRFSSGRHNLGSVTLYVSRGIGSTRLPLRYGCLPEITLFTLIGNGEVCK
ncbi:MAG TPA: metallophosphoesterase [Armatimonadota bacterium]|nr:metallophosphoesterase [Armatimonadota bacterium]